MLLVLISSFFFMGCGNCTNRITAPLPPAQKLCEKKVKLPDGRILTALVPCDKKDEEDDD